MKRLVDVGIFAFGLVSLGIGISVAHALDKYDPTRPKIKEVKA